MGRAKPGAANATDTTVRAKQLNLRGQNLDEHELDPSFGGDALRSRVTLTAAKSRHYSAAMRRDAYGVLQRTVREMGERDLERLLVPVVDCVARGFIDEEDGARGAAIALATALLDRVPVPLLAAVFPGWMQFCLLSLTHIEPAIQRDGLAFVSTAIDRQPALMVAYLARILAGVTPMLAARAGGGGRPGARSPPEIAVQAVQLYNATAGHRPCTLLHDYVWAERQTRSLRLTRAAPAASGLEPLPAAQLAALTERLLEAFAEPWLDAAELLAQPQRLGVPQREQAAPVLRCIAELRVLAAAAGQDDEFFWQHFPRRMLGLLGRGAREKLLRHLAA